MTENSNGMLTIKGWLLGSNPPITFAVDVKQGRTVRHLRDELRQQEGCPPKSTPIRLFKAFKPISELLKLRWFESEWQEILAMDHLYRVFEDLPDHLVHVIIVPEHAGGVKRPSSPTAISDLRALKIAKLPPSSIAQPANYQRMQLSAKQQILDDPPQPDWTTPAAPLLYDGFGVFTDIFMGTRDAAAAVQSLKVYVDMFARTMAQFYPDQVVRRDAALYHLNIIFKGFELPSLEPSAIGHVVSDGHNKGPHGELLTIIQVKNELENGKSHPDAQALAYVAHSHAAMSNQDLFNRWRVPALGITIAGHSITFYAIISLRRRYRTVALTPTLSCSPFATNGRDRLELYRAFAAACDIQTRIIGDVDRAMKARYRRLSITDAERPFISQLHRFGNDDPNDFFRFDIEEHYDSIRINSRQLYIASSDSYDGEVIVKFVQRYCLELHSFCYERGHAPKVLAYQKLSGGWLGIAMEYVPSARTLDRPELASDIRALVDEFHREGLVHGDLRECNIICTDDNWWIIDFDWSGIAGQVEYPTANLTEELLVGRSGRDDLKITVEDDLTILKRALERVAKGHNTEFVPGSPI